MKKIKDIRQHEIAYYFRVTQPFISEIKRGNKSVTSNMAMQLSEEFPEKTARMWLKASYYEIQEAVWKSKYSEVAA